VLALRKLYPASEAPWRVPSLLLFSGSGMAAGGWLAGESTIIWVLCRGLCRRDYREPRQFSHYRHAGFPAKPLPRRGTRPLIGRLYLASQKRLLIGMTGCLALAMACR
jgi:hypothetical protein